MLPRERKGLTLQLFVYRFPRPYAIENSIEHEKPFSSDRKKQNIPCQRNQKGQKYS